MRNPAAQGRPDTNQAQVVKWYEELFVSVLDLSHVGFGCPDLAVGCSGLMELVEVKTEVGQLRASQKRFSDVWRGPKIRIIRDQQDVIEHVQAMRRKQAGA